MGVQGEETGRETSPAMVAGRGPPGQRKGQDEIWGRARKREKKRKREREVAHVEAHLYKTGEPARLRVRERSGASTIGWSSPRDWRLR